MLLRVWESSEIIFQYHLSIRILRPTWQLLTLQWWPHRARFCLKIRNNQIRLRRHTNTISTVHLKMLSSLNRWYFKRKVSHCKRKNMNWDSHPWHSTNLFHSVLKCNQSQGLSALWIKKSKVDWALKEFPKRWHRLSNLLPRVNHLCRFAYRMTRVKRD